MILYYIIIIYLIFVNLSYLSRRKYSKLYLSNKLQFIISFIIFLIFILYFMIFIKLMNLFREHKILDLKYYFLNFDLKILILCIILFYFSRKNFLFCVKINCYRLHYYFMNNDIESNIFKPYYNNIFNIYFNSFIYYSYPILYYINLIITTITYNFILFDLLYNNFILFDSLLIIPYYGLFKVLYNIVFYFECKHHALFEYFVRKYNYMLFLRTKNIIDNFEYEYDASTAEKSYLNYEKQIIREL